MAESVRRRLGLAMLAVTAIAGCAANEPADVAVSVPAAEVPRPHAASVEPGSGCAALVDAALAGLPAPDLAWRPVGPLGGIDNDLGLPLAGDAVLPACTLFVESPRPGPAGPRRLLGRERIRSSHADGVDRVANPQREALERQLARVEEGNRRTGNILSTGVAAVDLAGAVAESAIAGIDLLLRAHEAETLRRQAEALPAEIARPRVRRYGYDRLVIEAGRSAAARIAWQDRNGLRAAEGIVGETRRVHVDDGRRADDLGEEATAESLTLADLAAWERTPPPMPLSLLLERLRAAGSDPAASDQTANGPAGGIDALLAQWRAEDGGPRVTAADAPAMDGSLVRVDGIGGAGAGFFVAAEHALTLERLAAGSDLVRVTAGDGRAGFALVERRDRVLGLALLRMASAARPLAVAAAGPASGRARLAWPGGPAAGVDGQLLAGAAGEAALWQADAAALPLPGTPALAGGLVVAMVGRPGQAGAELLPASRLRAFLAAGPAGQALRQAAMAASAQAPISTSPPSGVSQASQRGMPSASP